MFKITTAAAIMTNVASAVIVHTAFGAKGCGPSTFVDEINSGTIVDDCTCDSTGKCSTTDECDEIFRINCRYGLDKYNADNPQYKERDPKCDTAYNKGQGQYGGDGTEVRDLTLSLEYEVSPVKYSAHHIYSFAQLTCFFLSQPSIHFSSASTTRAYVSQKWANLVCGVRFNVLVLKNVLPDLNVLILMVRYDQMTDL